MSFISLLTVNVYSLSFSNKLPLKLYKVTILFEYLTAFEDPSFLFNDIFTELISSDLISSENSIVIKSDTEISTAPSFNSVKPDLILIIIGFVLSS